MNQYLMTILLADLREVNIVIECEVKVSNEREREIVLDKMRRHVYNAFDTHSVTIGTLSPWEYQQIMKGENTYSLLFPEQTAVVSVLRQCVEKSLQTDDVPLNTSAA